MNTSEAEPSISYTARDLAIKLRRQVGETAGGGCYSVSAAKTVSVSAGAFIDLTEMVVRLAERVEELEQR